MALDRKFGKGVLKTALGVVAGIGIVAGAAFAIFGLLQRLGIVVSYTGLTREQVLQVMRELDGRADVLSRVQGGTPEHEFVRGIYLGGAATFPLYYRADFWADGRASFKIYPLLWSEEWSTFPDVFRQTGQLVFPPGEE